MGLRSNIRKRVIDAVQYAVREEMQNINNESLNNINPSLDRVEDEIVQKLDKQIERWTWERYKRVDSLFEVLGYDLDHDLNRGIDQLEKKTAIINSRETGKIQETIDEKTRYWTEKRYEQTNKQIDKSAKEANKQIEKSAKETNKQIERWTWERYKRAENHLLYVYKLQNQISELLFQSKKVPYLKRERIRIVFLFQVASFWPSWDSFYQACVHDRRIDVKLVFLDETVREKAQMVSAKDFLEQEKLRYINFEDIDIDAYKPHVIVIQTPYDAGHRRKEHWSAVWKAKGYRVVYVPYGIEISDTATSRGMHFEQHVVQNAWRIYTFNEIMIKDYRKYCINATNVRSVGLPKFDSLFVKKKYPLDDELVTKIAGRKICLWKVHFPKIFEEKGKDIIVTPDMNEYIKFAEYVKTREDVFFIFMPHPRFKEPVKQPKLRELAVRLADTMEGLENVYIDEKDDYRHSLVNANCIIIDRSAVMVEAGAMGVPVLYMINDTYEEPVTRGIKPMIDSYYIGTTCDDMVEFLNNSINGIDSKKYQREVAFELCYPYFDGKAGKRIKENIIESLKEEELR